MHRKETYLTKCSWDKIRERHREEEEGGGGDGSYLTKCAWDKIWTCLIVAHEPKSKTIAEIEIQNQ